MPQKNPIVVVHCDDVILGSNIAYAIGSKMTCENILLDYSNNDEQSFRILLEGVWSGVIRLRVEPLIDEPPVSHPGGKLSRSEIENMDLKAEIATLVAERDRLVTENDQTSIEFQKEIAELMSAATQTAGTIATLNARLQEKTDVEDKLFAERARRAEDNGTISRYDVRVKRMEWAALSAAVKLHDEGRRADQATYENEGGAVGSDVLFEIADMLRDVVAHKD